MPKRNSPFHQRESTGTLSRCADKKCIPNMHVVLSTVKQLRFHYKVNTRLWDESSSMQSLFPANGRYSSMPPISYVELNSPVEYCLMNNLILTTLEINLPCIVESPSHVTFIASARISDLFLGGGRIEVDSGELVAISTTACIVTIVGHRLRRLPVRLTPDERSAQFCSA